MSQAFKFTGIGLAALVGGLAVAACGGDDGDDNGRGGSSNGGSSTGGSSTGGSGTGGSSTGGQMAYACADVIPSQALVTDFTGAAPPTNPLWGGTDPFNGGVFAYGGIPMVDTTAAVPLVIDASGGNFMVSGSVATYSGLGLYVASCANASTFDGVSFTISGDVPDGNVLFSLQTNTNLFAAAGVGTAPGKGACLAAKTAEFTDCVPPSFMVTGVTTTPQTVNVTWAMLGMGKPSLGTMGQDIVGFQWSFPWMPPAAQYDGEIVIDNVSFIGEGGGGGGAPGAGGTPGAGGGQ